MNNTNTTTLKLKFEKYRVFYIFHVRGSKKIIECFQGSNYDFSHTDEFNTSTTTNNRFYFGIFSIN